MLLRLVSGGGRRGGERRGRVRPPASPVGSRPAGFGLLAKALFRLVALQPVHHFNGHLRHKMKSGPVKKSA